MNSWIVIELTLIFAILWFCSDYLVTMGKKYAEPKGFDISHTYNVKLDTLSNGKNEQIKGMTKNEIFALILKRIKANPSVENACVSVSATPYSGSFMSMGYKVDSLANQSAWTKLVTPEFFDVFRIQLEKDKGFSQMKGTITNGVLLGQGKDGAFLDIPIDKIDSISNSQKYKILGFMNPAKRSE
jgi:putative ABC transport system permease protein